MKTRRGTAGRDVLAGSGKDGYQLIGLGGNDSYTLRLFDYVVYPVPVPGGDTGEPKTVYVRDKVVEAANGGIDAVRLTVSYDTVGYPPIYPTAIVSAAELANIETVTLVSNGRSLWNVSVDDFANTVQGSALADIIDGNGGNDRVYGGGGADRIDGGLGNDLLYGQDGADTVTDLSGNNHLRGGAGNDVLTTGSGHDVLEGGDGQDLMSGGAGADRLFGGTGDDVMIGGAGADLISGGSGTDTASYEAAAHGLIVNLVKPSSNTGDAKGDTFSSIENLVGSNHGDTLTGGAVANRLEGRAGNDVLLGGGGNDVLLGGSGTDRLKGGAGDDRFLVVAGQGNDAISGGAGRDVFAFSLDIHHSGALATIADFESGIDSIEVGGISKLVASAEQVGQDAVLKIGTFLDLGIFGTVFNEYGVVTLRHTDIDVITHKDLGGTPVYRGGTAF